MPFMPRQIAALCDGYFDHTAFLIAGQLFGILDVVKDAGADISEGFFSVTPCDQQPGRPGQETLYPSSER